MSLEADAASSPPTIYKLEPSRFAQHRRSLILRLAILAPLLLAGLVYLDFHSNREGLFGLLLTPILVLSTIVYRKLRDARRNWQSLAFELRDGKLIRTLERYPVVELVPSDVTGFVESPRGIFVEAIDRNKRLLLSNNLSNYDELRGRLRSWAPAATLTESRPRSFVAKVRNACEVLVCLGVFAGPLYLIYTTRRAIILPLGIVLTLAMLGMILYVRNSPAMPIRAKKGMWLLLLLPALAMLERLYWR